MKKILLLSLLLCALFAHSQNQAPIAIADTFTVYQGDIIFLSFGVIKQNDSDPNGDALTVDSIYPTSNGYYESISNFSYKYRPNLEFQGVDSIEYLLCDNGAPQMCTTGKIYIRVYKFRANCAYDMLNPNKLKGAIVAHGNLFNDGGSDYNLMLAAPYEGGADSSQTYTVFSGSLWVGGVNADNGSIHMAGTTYSVYGYDFYAGPIRDSSLYDFENPDYKWNRVWKVTDEEIWQHNNYYTADDYIMPDGILNWPGNGNVSEGEAAQLAPFHDLDSDGIYEPFSGDYPKIKGNEAIYSIYNDEMPHTGSGGHSLKIEVHSLAYGFSCSQSEALKNTIFIDYEIINRSENIYDSTYVGFFSDMDLGGASDDFIACDVNRSLFYTFNGDSIDEPMGGSQGYGSKPPIQALAVLSGALQDDDGTDNAFGVSLNESVNGLGYGDGISDNERVGMSNFMFFSIEGAACCTDPFTGSQFYNYMKGTWKDGTQMVYGNNGHTWTIPPSELQTRYMYPGDTDPYFFGTGGVDPQYNLPGGWNELNTANSPNDRRGLSSTGPFTFKPGDVQKITIAYIFARDTSDNYNPKGVLDNYYDDIRAMFVADSTPCKQGAFTSIEKAKEQKQNIVLYPNPVNNLLHISSSEYVLTYSIFDVYGKLICDKKPLLGRSIDVQNLSEGLYLIQLNTAESSTTMKFVKR